MNKSRIFVRPAIKKFFHFEEDDFRPTRNLIESSNSSSRSTSTGFAKTIISFLRCTKEHISKRRLSLRGIPTCRETEAIPPEYEQRDRLRRQKICLPAGIAAYNGRFGFLILLFVIISTLIISSGCSSLKMNVSLDTSPFDQTMYGRTPARIFYDSSKFTFPLKMEWEYDAGAGFGHAPMIIVGSTMFVGTLRGELHAVDLNAGKRLGYLKTYSPVYSAPLLFRDLLVFCTESGKENLVAYNIPEGEVMWTADLGGIAASPLLYNDKLIVGGLNGKIVAYDKNGFEKWSYNTKSEIRSSPAVSVNSVFCATTKGEVIALNADDGTLVWKSSTKNAVYAGITVMDDQVIVASRDSSVYFFNAQNGSVTRRIAVGNKVMASPSVHNGTLYVATLDGNVLAYAVGSGELLWQFKANSIINTTPVITPGALFVGSLDKYIYALDPSTGNVLWKHQLPARIKTTPVVWKKSLFVAAEDKIIYRFVSNEEDK